MRRLDLVFLFLLGAAGAARAQRPGEEEILARIALPGESDRTGRRIDSADQLAEKQKWAPAVDEYLRIVAEAGDDLVRLNPYLSVQARRLCQARLAGLPPEALRLYRSRVDTQARKWLDQGVAARDPALLRRLVDEAFCSRYTDQALDLLGDLAFERGAFDEAEHWWRTLAPLASAGVRRPAPSADPLLLLYPDPQVDVARVRAKQVLARLFKGDREGAEAGRRAFETLHPKAEGRLAGRTGGYATILGDLLARPPDPASAPADESWPTYAGDPSRNRVLAPAGALNQLPLQRGPDWTAPLVAGRRNREAGPEPEVADRPLTAARALTAYPLVVGDRVLVSDGRLVTGFQLSTGRRVLQYDVYEGRQDNAPPTTTPVAEPDRANTLSAWRDRVFARLGGQALGPRRGGTPPDTYLVCLNLRPVLREGVERWVVKAHGPDGGPAAFEGAPVVDAGRVYVAVTRFPAGQAVTAIACYDADNGALLWQRDVCDIRETRDGERRYRHHLLTLAGTSIVYCSHAGAIAAVDAASGRRLWAVRYPTRGPLTPDFQPSPRGLVPCLYADGRLYAAPLDFDRIWCLDPDTGRLIWESLPVEVIHLLGVAHGRLIFTMLRPQSVIPAGGLRALDAATGDPARGWVQPADGGSALTFGRGLLAGDRVYWPTSRGLRVLDQRTGTPQALDPTIKGNLASANGCLIVAGAESLAAYLPEMGKPEEDDRPTRP